jgi:hypothetical protein
MTIDAHTIREFRLLLRDFYDAQFEDWGEEANAPRFEVIERFLTEHRDALDELVELFLFSFLDLRGGICEMLERLGDQLDPPRLLFEIDDYGRRRPRDERGGYVRRMREALQSSVEGPE